MVGIRREQHNGEIKRTAHKIEHNGEIHCLSEWARIIGIERKTLEYYIKKGLSIEQIKAIQCIKMEKR